jgi:hypothetical protein
MKLDRFERRINALEASGRYQTANRSHPYWIDLDEPYGDRVARYRAYFEESA